MTAVLGISAWYHDSAAALLVDGRIVAAAQEERFSRRRHDPEFPRQAIRYCLREAGIELGAVEHIVYYEKPFLKFERLLESALAFAPMGFRQFAAAMPHWVGDKLFLKSRLLAELAAIEPGYRPRAGLRFAEHHQSHAASAFYPSPFARAAVLTLDGVGEWATTTAGLGVGAEVRLLREIHFPHSLGLLYSAFTSYCGFRVNSGEYKLMGLAPYGEPRYLALIQEHLVDLKEDGSFRLDMRCFDFGGGLAMTNRRFHRLFGGPPRQPEAALEPRQLDLAASIQAFTEEAVLRLARDLRARSGEDALCLAGGVALNGVANGRLLRESGFERIWVQPAAGDAGGALGAALALWHGALGGARGKHACLPGGDAMAAALLGPSWTDAEIAAELAAQGAVFQRLPREALLDQVAAALAAASLVGWFQGRAEFGPRALGARSILADPRQPQIAQRINAAVKFREGFRPFAPAVLAEAAGDWFDLDVASPYMALVAPVRRAHCLPVDPQVSGLARHGLAHSTIPAVTHVDGSARVQTVSADAHPLFHALIRRFAAHSGCPMLLNTSFNVRGEPIVGSPTDAWHCFMGSDLDLLAIGDCLLHKAQQDPAQLRDHASRFAKD